MADQSLQAFQLGASLFDRAQTQARIMEQMKLQTAESVLQQQAMQLQNKIRDNQYAEMLKEQEAQNQEYDTFQQFNQQVADFLNNATEGAAMPAAPRFRSKVFNQEAIKAVGGLQQYSVRAEHVKAQQRLAAAAVSQQTALLNNAVKYGAVTVDPESGAPKIDMNLLNQRATEAFNADVQKKNATTQAALDRVDIAERNLARMISEGASRNEIAQQRADLAQAGLDLRRELGQAGLDLRRQIGEANIQLGQQRQALSEELGRGRLAQGAERLAQGAERIQMTREKTEAAKTSALKPTKLDLDELEFSEAVLNGIQPMEPYLEQDLYGPTFNARVAAGAAFDSFSPEREVNQLYENMSSGAMFKRGGKSLTKSETARITSSIGKPTDTGFSDRVRTFKELQARSIKDRVEKLRMQGIADNPQYSGYLNELERRADRILGVDAAPQQQQVIRSFNTIEEAQSANLPVGTRILVGGRPATIK